MNPHMMLDIAAARGKDLRNQAAEARRAKLARRARRGGALGSPAGVTWS
jgi:hypothetical protein